jgi:glycosyltransferase involved in cell wall biosynthesis
MPKVIHLLPYDGIGGAEAAARSMDGVSVPGLDFQLRFLFPKVSSPRQRAATLNPLAALPTIREVLREKPDLLIVSLWRSCIAGLLVKLFRPSTRLIVVIHNSVDAHVADRIATRWAMAASDAVWTDSEASMRLRFRRQPRVPVTVIPFLVRRLSPLRAPHDHSLPSADFIFWGRLAAQKNLRRALEVFQGVSRLHPHARFTVIGPDSGELTMLREWCEREDLGSGVRFEGPMAFESIIATAHGHSFYLQTSDYEGMAMSVVEAMQLGLVPVVTPVGEIGSYCRDGINAVIVRDTGAAAAEVLRLLGDADAWHVLRRQAIATWQGQTLYRDAVAAECLRLSARAAG